MKNQIKITLSLVFLLLSLPTLSLAGEFKVTRVYDGDTIKAAGHDIEIKVRLVGIDAPETSRKKKDPGQPYSQQARKYLAGLVLNKTVDIKGYGLDGYSRILGVIYLEGKNINLEVVKEGLAEAYRGKPPHGFDPAPYRNAEREARAAKMGMWSLGNKYISPKDWRRMQREK
jgi:endonuclease YncB( thermonuclease family)